MGIILKVEVDFESSSGEEEFNKWYNQVHVSDVLKVPGVVKGTRYERMGKRQEQPKYVAIYKIESEEIARKIFKTPEMKKALDDWQATWGDRGVAIRSVGLYRSIYSP